MSTQTLEDHGRDNSGGDLVSALAPWRAQELCSVSMTLKWLMSEIVFAPAVSSPSYPLTTCLTFLPRQCASWPPSIVGVADKMIA